MVCVSMIVLLWKGVLRSAQNDKSVVFIAKELVR